MPIPDLLLVRNRAGSVGGYELANGNALTQLGVNIPGAVTRNNGGDDFTDYNDSIEFRGSKYLLTQTATSNGLYRIYKFDGANWNQVFENAAPTGGGDMRNMSGLFIYDAGSEPRLAFVHKQSNFILRVVHSPDGAVWTETGIGTAAFSNLDGRWMLHNNEMWHILSSTNTVMQFDLVGFTVTFYAKPGQAARPCLLFEQAQQLYLINVDAFSNGDLRIYKFTGAGFVFVADITTDNRWQNIGSENGSPGVVVIGNDVYLFMNGMGTGGTADAGSTFFHLARTGVDTWTITENNTVIPASLRPGIRGSGVGDEDRWMPFIDTETNPLNPEIYLFVRPHPAPGSGTSLYKFVDTSTEMTFQTASVANDYVFPENLQGDSQAVSRGAGNRAEIIDTAGVSGGTQVSYRVYGTVLSQTVKAYITDEGGVPVTQATLTDSATGGSSTRVGNEIQSVDGDDGATLYTFVIDNIGSGLGPAEKFYVKLDIR